jgi:hypothetical protein
MIIENASAFIELDISVPVGPGQGRRAGIGVGWGDFRATRAEVWLEHGEFEGFLHDLRLLSDVRQGRATLAADNPRDFQLTLAITDKAGHVEVSARLASHATNDGEAAMELRFPLDPSVLPEVLRDFERPDAAA